MVTGLTLNLFDFQEQAVLKLLDLTTDSRCKQTIVVKSPTGSGKTVLVTSEVRVFTNACVHNGNANSPSRKILSYSIVKIYN